MTPSHWLLCLSLSTLLTACTTAMTPPVPALHNTWLAPESTTKTEIARQYGQPAAVVVEDEDTTAWSYFSITSRPHAGGLIPFVGFFVAGSTIEMHHLTLHFTGQQYHGATQDSIARTQNMYAGITEKAPLFAEERQHVVDEMARLHRAFDPDAWQQARRSLRLWQMLRE